MTDHDPSAADPLGEIADEFMEALRQGKRPSIEEFARRYPEQADELRDMLPALMLMEKAKATEAPGQRPSATASAAMPLRQLGDYELLREVGRGGMGVVYEAQQLSLGRHVAIKVLPSHALLDPRHLARFQREARSAARLHHTNIVPVFGVGEQDGLHYYVMQFIHGLGLDLVLDEMRRLRQHGGKPVATPGDAADRGTNANREVAAVDVARSLLSGAFRTPDPSGARTAPGEPSPVASAPGALGSSLPVRAADASASIHLPGQTETSTLSQTGNQYWQSVARVGVQVAEALAYAASQGVLHRDIKPSNLLLDETGNVWVTDFGLAKADSDGDNLTHTGDIVGTLRYMAPERFNGQGDVRSDVYSLGLTLYELLLLRPAFHEADRNRLVKQVMHGEPVRPRKINPGVPRDLETVVLKAIARDPAHRYQSPTEMADDLKRFVEDRPVKARRVSEAEKFWRWCRRNPALAGALAAAVLLFWVAFAGITWNYVEAEAARKDEARERAGAEDARRREAGQREQAEKTLYFSNIARAQLEYRANNIADAEDILDRCPQTRRGWEWHYLKHLCHADLFTLPRENQKGHSGWVYDVVYSPDGKWLASAGGGNPFWQSARAGERRPGEVILWDAVAGTPIRTFRGHKNIVNALAFSPDGRLIASASPGDSVHVRETASGRLLRILPEGWSVAFSPNGKWLATGNSSGAVQLWDLTADPTAEPRPQTTFSGEGYVGKAVAVVFSPDSRCLACARQGLEDSRGEIRVWNVPAGTEALALQSSTGPVNRVQFSPDGHYLAADLGGKGSACIIRLWDVATGQLVQSLAGHHGHIPGLVFDPTSERLASAGADATVRVWTVPRGQEIRLYRGHRNVAQAVAFSRDGKCLASVSVDGTLKVWDLMHDPETADLPGREPLEEVEAVAFAGKGQQLMVARRGGRLTTLDCDTHADVGSARQVGCTSKWMTPAEPAAFDPDGRLFVGISADDPRVARCWDARTGTERATLCGHTLELWLVTVNASGRVATAGRTTPSTPLSEVKVWDSATAKPLLEMDLRDFLVERLALNPQGDSLAVSGRQFTSADRELRDEMVVSVYDVATGRVVRSFAGGSDRLQALAFSPDGEHLAAAGANQRTVLLWDLESERPVITHQGPEGAMDLSFSPDGRRLAMASRRMIKLLDAASGEEVLILRGFAHLHPDTNSFNPRVRFSPDGRKIAAVCHDIANPISIWSPEDQKRSEVAPQRESSEDSLWLAQAHFRAGKFREALASVKDDPHALCKLARLFDQQGNAPLAEEARGQAQALFEKRLSVQANNPLLASELADLLLIGKSARWTVLKPAEMKSEVGAKLTLQDDGSIRAEGGSRKAESDALLIDANVGPVKALKIETSTHTSPPKDGSPFFNEYQILTTRSSALAAGACTGRYVRIDLPGDKKQFPRLASDGDKKELNLAELQVFQGNQNIALRKSARQSSTWEDWGAARAVDGNTDGRMGRASIAHTDSRMDGNHPWWEVDLGSEQKIDRMVIWNRVSENCGPRMSHFRIRVLDTSRNVVFEQFFAKPPAPSREVRFRASVTVSEAGGNYRLALRLARDPRQDQTAHFRVSVTQDLLDLSGEDKWTDVRTISNPWARLVAAYHVLGNRPARDALLKQHPAAAAGIGDLYTASQDWEQAIAEYSKVIPHQPSNTAVLTRLVMAYQAAGHQREAMPHLATLSAANPKDMALALRVAALQAWFGQEKEFAATRRRILAFARGTEDMYSADRAAKACCILPPTDQADLESALVLARMAVKASKGVDWMLMSLGMAEYRSGNDAAALEALLAAAKAGPNNAYVTSTSAFYPAMSLFRQGKRDEARRVAAAAAAKMKPLPADENNPLPNNARHDDIILWLAYKEAKAMIGFDAAGAAKAKSNKK